MSGVQDATIKVRPDPVPNLRSAGAVIATGGHNADMMIRTDMYAGEIKGNVGTPPHIRKYRKTNNLEPGQIMVHPGLQDGLPKKPLTYAFGKQTVGTEAVNHVIKAQNLNGLADKFNDAKEGKYASAVREPLGKSYQRGYGDWPGQNPDHNFGVPTNYSVPAKDILYPMGGSLEEKAETAKMYQKTHGNFGPGEQRTRDYNWSNPKVADGTGNILAHPFGYGEQRLLAGAAKSIQPERIEESFPKTVIVKKIVEDQKGVTQDMLGTVKNLGQGQGARDPDYTYGQQRKNLDWNAGRCITGEPNEQQVQPDKDLGRSVKANCTNQVRREEDKDRAFGCPTIRVDVPFKPQAQKSVADYQNYGDEPEAVDLLFPSTHTEVGINEADFQMPRDR